MKSLPTRPTRKRNIGSSVVTTKLSPQEVEDIERLAKKYGPQRSEFIRQLILDELARGSGEPTVSTELTETVFGLFW